MGKGPGRDTRPGGERVIVELREYKPAYFARDAIPREVGEALYESYRDKVEVEPPSFRTGDQWKLTAQGWVGYIPLTPDVGVALRPKVPIGNLFRMLEYAYRLESFKLLEGLFDAATLEEFYDRLANVLALRVLDRGRKGFHRRYEPESGRLPYVRGRMDAVRAAQSPWDVRTLCHYEEHTADTEDNRILAWTMYTIARGALRNEEARRNVRQAYRQLAGLASLEPQPARVCTGRHYTRLNEDYRPLHALCRFFLENSGPSHEVGDRRMLPFLVDMARLYELFVAEWLREHLPPRWRLETQEHMTISREAGLSFAFDLVLYDRETDLPVAVLDTKYKAPDAADNNDIYQVHTYTHAKGCTRAYLVYPAPMRIPLNVQIRSSHVRSLSFAIDGDLERAGRDFLTGLMRDVDAGSGMITPPTPKETGEYPL